jgi:hypothetical protein
MKGMIGTEKPQTRLNKGIGGERTRKYKQFQIEMGCNPNMLSGVAQEDYGI